MEMQIDESLPMSIEDVSIIRPGAENLSVVAELGVCSYELDGKLMVVRAIYESIQAKNVRH